MKKIFTLIALMVCGVAAMAQGLRILPFSAELRDANGELIKGASVGYKYKIYCGNFPQYVLERSGVTTTTDDGVLNLRIGTMGTATSNNTVEYFDNLPFELTAYDSRFILVVDIDPKGGSNYTISGSTSLATSVPYAQYARLAKNAESAQSFGDMKLTTVSNITGTNELSFTICGKDKTEITTNGLNVPMYSTVLLKAEYPKSAGEYIVYVNDVQQGSLNYEVDAIPNSIIGSSYDPEKDEIVYTYGTLYKDVYTCSGNVQNDTKNKVYYIPVFIGSETPTIKITYNQSKVY